MSIKKYQVLSKYSIHIDEDTEDDDEVPSSKWIEARTGDTYEDILNKAKKILAHSKREDIYIVEVLAKVEKKVPEDMYKIEIHNI
jgi:hypothetical protein